MAPQIWDAYEAFNIPREAKVMSCTNPREIGIKCNTEISNSRFHQIHFTLDDLETNPPPHAPQPLRYLAQLCLCGEHQSRVGVKLLEWQQAMKEVIVKYKDQAIENVQEKNEKLQFVLAFEITKGKGLAGELDEAKIELEKARTQFIVLQDEHHSMSDEVSILQQSTEDLKKQIAEKDGQIQEHSATQSALKTVETIALSLQAKRTLSGRVKEKILVEQLENQRDMNIHLNRLCLDIDGMKSKMDDARIETLARHVEGTSQIRLKMEGLEKELGAARERCATLEERLRSTSLLLTLKSYIEHATTSEIPGYYTRFIIRKLGDGLDIVYAHIRRGSTTVAGWLCDLVNTVRYRRPETPNSPNEASSLLTT